MPKGPQHRLQTANRESFTLVRLDARSGTQDLFVLGPLAVTRCTARPMTDRLTNRGRRRETHKEVERGDTR
eukprot:1184885-Prorocentrum_minimum.AAC.6